MTGRKKKSPPIATTQAAPVRKQKRKRKIWTTKGKVRGVRKAVLHGGEKSGKRKRRTYVTNWGWQGDKGLGPKKNVPRKSAGQKGYPRASRTGLRGKSKLNGEGGGGKGKPP